VVRIREVGPRDGLQTEAPLDVADRAALVRALVDAGTTNIEAASFVSPRAVPAMADADKLLALLSDLPPQVTVSALVPNVRGAELAIEARRRGGPLQEITATVSASEVYSERNVHMSVDRSVAELEGICAIASSEDLPVDAVLSCSFGSPYEGDIPADAVGRLCRRLRSAGVTSLTLADTTGMATPRRICEVLAVTGNELGLHLHDTRGTALVNLYAAMQEGVVRFDAAVGGLGGSPFARGAGAGGEAGGNVATEDVVSLLDDLGVRSRVDLVKLIEVSKQLEVMVGHPVPSRVARAGPRTAGSG